MFLQGWNRPKLHDVRSTRVEHCVSYCVRIMDERRRSASGFETFGSLQQFLEDLSAHLVRGPTNSHFDGFEIKSATLAESREDHSQQRT